MKKPRSFTIPCSSSYHMTPNWTKRGCFILLCFFALFIICGCSKNPATNQEISPLVTKTPKSLMELAVDWGNENLFETNMSYDSFTLEEKTMDQSNYSFLLMNDNSSWENQLYYIVSENHSVQTLIPCGGGNRDLFSYELVLLLDNCYVAVDSASHMGNGGLWLYPLDHPEKTVYTIDHVIDNHYEGMALVDDIGREYSKSEVYEGGKLKRYYPDYNADGFTDITFTGTKLIYKDQIGEESNFTLSESWKFDRTYYYNEELDRFILGDETQELVEYVSEKSFDYTGYLDMNSNFAMDNPEKDYDGDGLLDRIYKEFQEESGSDMITLEFGNGSVLQLSDTTLGRFFKTESADLTGDGQNEILFEQYGWGTGGIYMYLSIFTLEGGGYVRMVNPYEEIDPNVSNASNAGGMFSIPLKIEKLNDTTVRLDQPDCGYQGQITTKQFINLDGSILNDIDHLYYPEAKDQISTYRAESVKLAESDENRTALYFQSRLGDKWVYYIVDWTLEYIDGEWRITKVDQPMPVRVDFGVEYDTDLNGDHQIDIIRIDTMSVTQDGFDRELPVITVNGTSYDGAYLENEYGISLANCSQDGYYIMDIDISDPYAEIAILDEGRENDPITYMFRYEGEQLTYCGAIHDVPRNHTFSVLGDGTLYAQKPLRILKDLFTTSEWIYDSNGILQEQTKEIYDIYWTPKNEDQQNIVTKNLVLFQNPEINQECIMILQGQTIDPTATDDEHWIQVSDHEGHQGWVYLQNETDITLPFGEGKIEDIFINLGD